MMPKRKPEYPFPIMQRFGGPRLLHMIPPNRHPTECQWRKIHPWPRVIQKIPMRKTFPKYEISDLLLNLDAEDNKHVRSYDEHLDGVPEENGAQMKRDQIPIRERVSQFEEGYQRDDSSFKYLLRDRFNPRQISDLDVIAVALRGPPQTRPAGPSTLGVEPERKPESMVEKYVTQAVFESNGTPKEVLQTASKAIPFMLRRQYLVNRRRPGSDDLELVQEGLGKGFPGNSFSEFKRVVANLLHTLEGRSVVSGWSSAVAAACRREAQSGSPSDIEALAFLNDVSTNLTTMDLKVSPFFIQTGVLLGMHCYALPAVRDYLAIGAAHGYHEPRPENELHMKELTKCLSKLLCYITESKRPYMQIRGLPNTQVSRVGVYSLLTGQDFCGQRVQVSFDTIRIRLKPDLTYDRLYLHILGELGALRTLWHEFAGRQGGPPGVKSTPSKHVFEKTGVAPSAEIFVSAFVRILRNIEAGRISIPSSLLMEVTGDYHGDCLLDMKTIMESSRHTLPAEVNSDTHGPHVFLDDGNLSPSQFDQDADVGFISSALWNETLEAFRLPLIQEAMPALRAIVIRVSASTRGEVSCHPAN